MPNKISLHEVSRLPLPGDNVAIATRRLEAGSVLTASDGHSITLGHTVLEGHRFALQPIAIQEPLLSWGLPFGYATAVIAPGEYVCNQSILESLTLRNLDFDLPESANFRDHIQPYQLDEASFTAAPPLDRYASALTFRGYRRDPRRGVGTRNFIVLIATTSRTGSYVKQLEERVKHLAVDIPNLDGIVAVAHTEGGSGQPNNRDLLLRTLAGFMVHPNVGAALAVDYGVEPVTNQMLRDYLVEQDYPIDDLPHEFLSLTGPFQQNLEQGEQIVRGWLDEVGKARRTDESASSLKLALQCGGSDAFSGISGNPLAAWVARELIRYGGAANLAETDELIGAEPYILQKVRDLTTAQKFLATVERFKERVAWHGHSAEGNPSGGNKFRGLYNIVLKSIGAAMKKHPEVRLDYVIDYAEPMRDPGYYFMDSPGNDLESIAGQVASGSNIIYFVTGNGSITNFPFVPTIKIVTTTRRYQLLTQEMDINAGEYLDGVPMDDLGDRTLHLTLDVASGMRSAGEKAGHAQVQIWRNWRQTNDAELENLLNQPEPLGASLPIQPPAYSLSRPLELPVYQLPNGRSIDQVGLILPTSLCSGQIARLAAIRLNKRLLAQTSAVNASPSSNSPRALSRFVSLVHTEGCGTSGGTSEELYLRTMLGYLGHPSVRHALLLEHGCEKTHNDFMRHQMIRAGLDPDRFGWASVQLDGGIESAMAHIEQWFAMAMAQDAPATRSQAGPEALRLGLGSGGPISDDAAETLAALAALVVHAGGTVVVPQNAGLLSHPVFLTRTLGKQPAMPTISYGESAATPGFHIMETPTSHWVETLTGLGATGVELIVASIGEHPLQTHPLVPLLQIAEDQNILDRCGDDIDVALQGSVQERLDQLASQIGAVAEHTYTPSLYQLGNIDFQVTRGLLGVSM